MTKRNGSLLAGLTLVVLIAVGGYWTLRQATPDTCRICRRDIHPQARAVAEVEGKREPVCCVRCALTLARQQRKPVRLVEVTDYATRRPLSPDAAYYVEGSGVVLCAKHEPLLDQTKESFQRVFDRCEPSLYAFARREDAEKFIAANGGAMVRWEQLVKEGEPRP